MVSIQKEDEIHGLIFPDLTMREGKVAALTGENIADKEGSVLLFNDYCSKGIIRCDVQKLPLHVMVSKLIPKKILRVLENDIAHGA